MARQSATPIQFEQTLRPDNDIILSSGRAGVVIPVGFVPLLRNDSASGSFGIDIKLAEMPKPLLNAVHANVQAWFVPKAAHPQFFSYEEFVHSYQKEQIKALGVADRSPPALFSLLSSTSLTTFANSTFAKTLGLHFGTGATINADLIDAFNLVYNFRSQAHSNKLPLRKFASQDLAAAITLPPAFWPSGRFSSVVADYERALVVGALDLDVAAGRAPFSGFGILDNGAVNTTPVTSKETTGSKSYPKSWTLNGNTAPGASAARMVAKANEAGTGPDFWAELAGMTIGTTLADIDMARKTQAFARMATSFAGGDITGFDQDGVKIAELLQGFTPTPQMLHRPWLLDSKRVTFGMVQRHATDAANLDQSVSVGRAGATLSINVPRQESGGMIIFTVEVLPERLDERQSDEFFYVTDPEAFPNALRDIQRIEPVDNVINRRLDAKHTAPNALYGYEPMNNVWRRDFARLGGDYYSPTPGAGWTESRSNIWMADIVNPAYTADHFVAPVPFPHTVFSDTNASAFELVARHQIAIVGQTLIGDVLYENNDEYETVQNAGA